jgi:hypothetical protein
LLSLAAINAFAGGYYGMSGAQGVPLEWLKSSPFQDYFIPGIILFVLVGGAFLVAAIAVFAKKSFARTTAFISVLIVFVWLAVEVAIIGYVSWMQPTTALVSLVILILSWKLKENGTK